MSEEAGQDWDEVPDATVRPQDQGNGFRWGLIPLLALIVVIAVAAAQNTQTVELQLFTWHGTAPLIVIIVATVVVAVLLDEIVGLVWRRRRRKRRAERAELDRLRSMNEKG